MKQTGSVDDAEKSDEEKVILLYLLLDGIQKRMARK